jgi:hypothetical protein
MTLYYANIDANGALLGFYTDTVNGTNIPTTAVSITAEQWQQWLGSSNGYRWIDGTLTPFTPPPPTIQQQAMMLLNSPVLTVNCTSLPALNADYLVDSASRGNITGIAVAINGGLGLPSGEETFNYPDTTGTSHPWPGDQFIAFAQGTMVYVYNLSQVAGGNSSAMPSSTLIIA